jgi:hypothetical protein
MMMHTLIYIDPGSGSYLVQVIIAAVLGAAVYFKTIMAKLRAFFGGQKKTEEPDNPEEND